ncbi:MAG: N-acetyl sugar amidotransferase [Candidatus Scalindua sp.]|nr:N-acetyl sugar amidotransferase [Candidatus Scalindua sp.]
MNDNFDDLQRCIKCTLPITWETLNFDQNGVCNICRNWEAKTESVDWEERERILLKIFEGVKERNKDREYDCIVPFSGGKDSTYTLYAIVRKYGLKPLVVSFDHGFYRPKTIENRTRTFKKLGVDVINFTPNWKIVKKLMLESLIRKGDFCWHCHAGVFSYPMQFAVKFNIPLLIWGEGGGEYETYFRYAELEETDEWKYNRRIIMGMRAEDLAGFINVELRDLSPFIYPSKEELDKVGVKSLPLGNYIQWNQEEFAETIQKELGWNYDEVESLYPDELGFDKVECMMTGIRDYIKYLKRGFSRITHRTTIDIKQGRISRDEGLALIRKYEHRKPASLPIFLKILDLSEEEFNRICLNQLIPPAIAVDPDTIPVGKKLWDQDLWLIE